MSYKKVGLQIFYILYYIQIVMNNIHTKYIIVGAGISGLQAANNLAQLDQDFIILEAQNRIGGRIKTLTIAEALKQDKITCNYAWFQKIKDTPVQVGATWVCQEHSQMQQLAKKYKINLYPQYYQGKHILALSEKTKLHLEEYQQYYCNFKEKLMFLVEKMWKIRDRYEELLQNKKIGKISQEQFAQLKNMYEVYDTMSGYQFIHNQLQDQQLSRLIDNQIQTLQSISSKHFSVLQFLNDDAAWHGIYFYLGIRQHNIDGYRAAQGLSALLDGMKNNIQTIFNQKGVKKTLQQVLKLNHPVIEVRNDLNPVEVVTENGLTFTCQKVLMCIPAGVSYKIKFGKISPGKKLFFDNMLTSHTIRMTIVFPTPFWRKMNHSGNVNFSQEFPMNQLVELTPEDESCGIVAFVFFKQGYQKWLKQIEEQYNKLLQTNNTYSLYQLTKKKSLKIISELFLQGDMESQFLKQCVLFTRTLSQSPFIRNTYDSTPAIGTYKKLFQINQDHLDPFERDEQNLLMLGSDFWQVEQHAGYMQGAIRVANSKINKQFIKQSRNGE